jgi:NADPH:quinone reductase-like Zn-dependent oxidoreductase
VARVLAVRIDEHGGTIRPAIAESLPLRDAAGAHELLEARAVIGKVLLEV